MDRKTSGMWQQNGLRCSGSGQEASRRWSEMAGKRSGKGRPEMVGKCPEMAWNGKETV